MSGIQASRQTLTTSTNKYDKLTSKLSGLLDEMKTLVDETRVESVHTLRGVSSDLENVEDQVKTNCAKHINVFNEFKHQMTGENASITASLDKCLTVAKTIRLTEAEMVQICNSKEEHLIAGLAEMDTNFMEQKNKLIDKVNDTFNQIENTCEMTRLDIDSGLNGLVDDVTTEQDRIDAHQFEFEDTMNIVQSTQNEFHETLKADIDYCQKRLQTFQHEELQMYTPTGQTPSKREYKYPKNLVTTSPHDEIITDFWKTHSPADLECSAIISNVSWFLIYLEKNSI